MQAAPERIELVRKRKFSSSRRSSNHAGLSKLSSKENVKLSLENKKKPKSKKSKAVSGELDFKKYKRKSKKANSEKTPFENQAMHNQAPHDLKLGQSNQRQDKKGKAIPFRQSGKNKTKKRKISTTTGGGRAPLRRSKF